MRLAAALVLAATCLSACASDPFTDSGAYAALSPAGQQAYGVLREAPFFSDACVGFACTTPPTVEAWRVLAEEPQAEAAFEGLVRDASLPGQLFGLVGLYYSDAEAYARHARRYARADLPVDYFLGCVRAQVSTQKIVRLIEDGYLPRSIRGF